MRTIRWTDSETTPNPHGVDARKIYDSEKAQVIHITLRPGERLKPHIAPVDVIFYVLEGRETWRSAKKGRRSLQIPSSRARRGYLTVGITRAMRTCASS